MEDVWLPLPSFMRLIGYGKHPFQCVPLSWQNTVLSGPGIWPTHYGNFGKTAWCVYQLLDKRETMIWVLVMTVPASFRFPRLLVHRGTWQMLEHEFVQLYKSALTEMAFSSAKEYRTSNLLIFERYRLSKLNRN